LNATRRSQQRAVHNLTINAARRSQPQYERNAPFRNPVCFTLRTKYQDLPHTLTFKKT